MTERVISRYQIFMVTYWQEREQIEGSVGWRFRMETPRDDRRWLFTSLSELAEAIEDELDIKQST